MIAYTEDKIGYFFADALSEVIKTTSGFSFDISSPVSDSGLNEMTGIMCLYGNNPGMIILSASEEAVRMICAYMTGTPKNDVTSADADDTLCELINMTAGNVKSRINDEQQMYTLSTPFMIRGYSMKMLTKNRVTMITRVLKCDNLTLKLKIVFY